MEESKRYFIVYFTGVDKEGERERGKIHLFVHNGGYVNEKYIHKAIENDFGLSKPYVERVEELDEADFYDFIGETPDDLPSFGGGIEDFL